MAEDLPGDQKALSYSALRTPRTTSEDWIGMSGETLHTIASRHRPKNGPGNNLPRMLGLEEQDK